MTDTIGKVRCLSCGSTHVQIVMWVCPNDTIRQGKDEYVLASDDYGSGSSNDTQFCLDCDEHVRVTSSLDRLVQEFAKHEDATEGWGLFNLGTQPFIGRDPAGDFDTEDEAVEHVRKAAKGSARHRLALNIHLASQEG